MPREVGPDPRPTVPQARRQLQVPAVAVTQFRQCVPYLDLRPSPSCLDHGLREASVAQGEVRQRQFLSSHQTRVVERAAKDEPRDRVQVRGEGLAPQPHCLQRNRPAARKRVQHARCPPAERGLDLLAEPLQLRPVLPSPVQDAARGLLELRVLAAVLQTFRDQSASDAGAEPPPGLVVAWISQQRAQNHRAAGSQWSPRGPDVQGGQVAVPNVLLVNRVQRDLGEGQGGFGEAGDGVDNLPAPAASGGQGCQPPRG